MHNTLFRFRDVSFNYPGGSSVLEDLNLEIGANELFLIRGESGAGKSTFLQLFNRFCDSGNGVILYHGRDIREYGIEKIRKSIIYLPQIPHVIEGSVEDNLRFPFSFTVHRDNTFDASRAEEWLDYFQLQVSLRDEALKLSVGQKQRISLIRAMLLEPEVLLLDEPGSALDEANKKLIEQKIESLLRSSDVTVLMASHSTVSFAHTSYRDFEIKNRTLKELK
ncbi:MAG: ATP-binding cassette domain-containing protein [Nitrospiraceae bacterium]|nr:MAG: ATP-binding cassette domain-containing protein [Nitrospiraceae bacterium]